MIIQNDTIRQLVSQAHIQGYVSG